MWNKFEATEKLADRDCIVFDINAFYAQYTHVCFFFKFYEECALG